MAREILLISEAPITTVQLLEQVLSELEATTPLRTRSRLLAELSPDDFTPETFPLIVRSADAQAYSLARALRRLSIPYGFYLDDNFWLLDPATEIGRYYSRRRIRHRLDVIIRGASTVIASTPLLRDYLLRFNTSTIQLDSFFDFSLVPRLPPGPRPRALVRGGFAASAHRGSDLEPILADMIDVLEQHPHVEFELIGVDESSVPAHPRIRTLAYRDSYDDYQRFQRSRAWDFGLAPLGDALSNLYKTDNKFREYAAQGIPGIYQDLPPYSSVRDGETGLLAGGSRSWRDAMELYIGDRDLRDAIRTAARADAEERCALPNVAPRWGEFFTAAPEAGQAAQDLRGWLARRWRTPPQVRRGVLLVQYGVSQLRERGFLSTVGRTARFLTTRRRPGE